MIPAPVQDEILRRLRAAEEEHRVKVLLAVESGSRAWGFESPDSDFDARFIYVHETEWYLSIDDQRDVIEYPIVDDIDLNGWDLRKALRLFRNSNPALVEWIQSPVVYLEHGPFAAECRALLPEVYCCRKGIHHYRNMAKNNFQAYLRKDRVSLKKYLYVLRPLLSVRWLEAYTRPAPMQFSELLHLLDGQTKLLEDIHALLEAKRAAPEMGVAPRVPSIHAFVESELQRLDVLLPEPEKSSIETTSQLNELFVRCLPDRN